MLDLALSIEAMACVGSAASPYAAYALALDFASNQYWSGGARAASLSALPGYNYTRSGTMGTVDTDGGVDNFAANVPPINDRGYNAYGALTNLLPRSQEFDGAYWGALAETCNTNVSTAPDGTTTADKIIPDATSGGHAIWSSISAGTGTFTFSVLAKADGYPRLGMRVYDGAAYQLRATFDLSAGTIVSTEAGSAYIIACGGGWYRCVIVGASPSGSMGSTSGWVIESLPGGATVQQNFTGDGASGTLLWQAQALAGNFPDGGPIIPTTSAAASIGAGALSANVNPITTDQDFIWWAIAEFTHPASGYEMLASMGGTGHYLARRPDGGLEYGNNTAGPAGAGAPVATGRAVVLGRRRSGKDTCSTKIGNTITIGNESALTGFGNSSSTLMPGLWSVGSQYPLNQALEGVFIRTGTFSDADITAVLGAA